MDTHVDLEHLKPWFKSNRNRIIGDLSSYVAIDTSLGKEEQAFPFLERYLSNAGFSVRREPFHPELARHYAVSPHPASCISSDRTNLRATFLGHAASERTLLFNCHVDVVPASENFRKAFEPWLEDGKLFGRGSCDTKNNLIMLVEALRYISENNLPLGRSVHLDLPIDEEVGGNGTLSTILHGVQAEEVVVLEPTNLHVYRGHRGCLTFSVNVIGCATHMGSDKAGESAIMAAFDVIKSLELLEAELLVEARLDPDFAIWEKPLQLNVGIIRGGEWVGSVPERCEIVANIGFLPRYEFSQIEQLIRTATTRAVSTRTHIGLIFNFACGLRNAAYIQSGDGSLAKRLAASILANRGDGRTFGWRVSCDAHYYDKVAALPVVIFGCGSLGDAHSAHENIPLAELQRGISILVDFLTKS